MAYETRVEEQGKRGQFGSFALATADIVGVKGGVVVQGKRLVAFWCSAREEVRYGSGANEVERAKIVRRYK